MNEKKTEEIGLLPVVTLVIWVSCVIVGAVGLLWPGRPAPPPTTQPAAPATEVLNVEIAPDPEPVDIQTPSGVANATPDKSIAAAPEVAMPSPAIAFQLPVDGLVRLVTPRYAVPRLSVGPVAVHRLTFGVGQGVQPAPDYPIEAVLSHEQGDVGVTFVVGPDGTVTSAEATSPSRWPDLNQTTLSTIRERWHLPPGNYEIVIQFRLGNK